MKPGDRVYFYNDGELVEAVVTDQDPEYDFYIHVRMRRKDGGTVERTAIREWAKPTRLEAMEEKARRIRLSLEVEKMQLTKVEEAIRAEREAVALYSS